MGADYEGQEKAVKELGELSLEAKMFLNHHISNPLCSIICGIDRCDLNSCDLDMVKEAAWHIVKDLRLAGIKER